MVLYKNVWDWVNKKNRTYAVLIFFFILVFPLRTTISSEYSTSEKAGIPVLKWTGPGQPGSYDEYRDKQLDHPFYVRRIEIPLIHSGKPSFRKTVEQKILIFAHTGVYLVLSEKIHRYVNDLSQQGYTVHFYEYASGNALTLKSFIKSRKQNLLGCVFIGEMPAAWYEVEDDYYDYGYAQFPCDLFFMDLDGKWTDLDGNGIYDLHENGSGDRQPEIFLGRIDASMMDGNQFELLNHYFDKNHEYWLGGIYLLQFGLTYTEDDWSIYDDIVYDISHLYPDNYRSIKAPDTSRNDYLENRLTNILYEFVQLACHSNSTVHYFTREGELSSQDIRNAPPGGMVFNLFCCSGLRFTDANCLGGAYIFNQGAKALAVIGSTKTGSMLEFHHFYRSLRNKNSVGLALKIWFEMIAPYDDYDLFWHYGMTILGDPLLVLLYDQKSVFPPVNLSVSQVENRSLMLKEYINIVNWKSNPLNEGSDVTAFRVYGILEGMPQLITEVYGTVNEYLHHGVEIGKQHIYGVSCVRFDGLESFPALVELFNEAE